VDKPVLRSPSLSQGLLIACTGIGALVVFSAVSLALIPMLVGLAVLAFWIVSLVLIGWGGIELMAALERWLEGDSRFQR
jgi:hypothetical protein